MRAGVTFYGVDIHGVPLRNLTDYFFKAQEPHL